MIVVPHGVLTEPHDACAELSTAHSWWEPRWLRRHREDRELARWAAELSWQWSDAADVANLTRHSQTAAKIPVTVTPLVLSVDLGPPVTLLVRMLPGQIVDDFQAQEHRLAMALGVPAVRIEPYDHESITVALLDQESLDQEP